MSSFHQCWVSRTLGCPGAAPSRSGTRTETPTALQTAPVPATPPSYSPPLPSATSVSCSTVPACVATPGGSQTPSDALHSTWPPRTDTWTLQSGWLLRRRLPWIQWTASLDGRLCIAVCTLESWEWLPAS